MNQNTKEILKRELKKDMGFTRLRMGQFTEESLEKIKCTESVNLNGLMEKYTLGGG